MMDVEYTAVGDLHGLDQVALHREDGPVRSTTRLCVRDGRVVGFVALGRRWDHSVVADLLRARKPVPWVLARLPEASFDTEFTPKLALPRMLPLEDARGPVPGGPRG